MDENGERMVDGYIGELWRNLEEALLFKTKYIVGNITDERKALRDCRNCDILLNPVKFELEDFQEFDRTMPIAITWSQLNVMLYPGNSKYYLDAWSTSLWHACGLYIVLLSVILWMIANIRLKTEERKLNTKIKNKSEIHTTGDLSLMGNVLNIWSCITNQGLQIIPYSNSMRIASLAIITFGYILTSSYSAILISYVATNRVPPEITLEDLSLQDFYSLCVSEKSISYSQFQVAQKNGTINETWKKILNRPPCTVTQLKADFVPIDDYCNHQNIVLESKQTTNFMFQDHRREDCVIHTFQKRYDYSYISLLTNKNFKYNRLINIYLLKFHTMGLIKKQQEKWIPTYFHEENRLDEIAIVNYTHIKYVLLIYFLAMMFSIWVLFLEIIVHSYYRESEHQKKDFHV